MLRYISAIKKRFVSHRINGLFSDLKPGDIAIDCDAGVGEVAELMAAEGATVYAFEPHSVAWNKAKKRLAKYHNVICEQKAVWIEDGRKDLYLHKNAGLSTIDSFESSSLFSTKENVKNDNFVSVQVMDFCGFLMGLDRPVKLIKIDVEGAEFPILRKLIDSGLISRIGYLLVEAHSNKIPEFKDSKKEFKWELAERGIDNVIWNWNEYVVK